jgi:hypothetical protein
MLYDLIRNSGIKLPDAEELPPTSKFLTTERAEYIKIPSYGELLVVERLLLDYLTQFKGKVIAKLQSLAISVKKSNPSIKASVSDLLEPIYHALRGRTNLTVIITGVKPYSNTHETIRTIEDCITKIGEFDPETLLTSDGSWELRHTAYNLVSDLVEIGVPGETVEQKVKSIVEKKDFQEPGAETLYVDVSSLVEDLSLWGELDDFDYLSGDAWKLDFLLATRCNWFHTPYMLESSKADLVEQAKSEFPSEGGIATNPAEKSDKNEPSKTSPKGKKEPSSPEA